MSRYASDTPSVAELVSVKHPRDLPPTSPPALPRNEVAELLDLRRIARTASALLANPCDAHRDQLAVLLLDWRVTHSSS